MSVYYLHYIDYSFSLSHFLPLLRYAPACAPALQRPRLGTSSSGHHPPSPARGHATGPPPGTLPPPFHPVPPGPTVRAPTPTSHHATCQHMPPSRSTTSPSSYSACVIHHGTRPRIASNIRQYVPSRTLPRRHRGESTHTILNPPPKRPRTRRRVCRTSCLARTGCLAHRFGPPLRLISSPIFWQVGRRGCGDPRRSHFMTLSRDSPPSPWSALRMFPTRHRHALPPVELCRLAQYMR